MAEVGKKGLIIVHTGPGKGKTTAALGLAFRAVGSGRPLPVEAPGPDLGDALRSAIVALPVVGATGVDEEGAS